jgi:hypothetical protein
MATDFHLESRGGVAKRHAPRSNPASVRPAGEPPHASAGLPLFLQRAPLVSIEPDVIQRFCDPNTQSCLDDTSAEADAGPVAGESAAEGGVAACDPERQSCQEPEPGGGSETETQEDTPAPGELYAAQFRQLDILLQDRLRARAVTDWAMGFFQDEPSIEGVAHVLTRKIDDALLAVNRGVESLKAGFIFDLTNWFPGINFRVPIEYAANLYLERSRIPWLITYRIPGPVAVAAVAVEDMRGKCEEHAFLAVYLLTIGHMIQNMPFGQLRGDIFYTGAASESHAVSILVLGDEFKDALRASVEQTGGIDARWLCAHTDLWGPNAWIVDGWSGKASRLAQDPIALDYARSQEFRRDRSGGLTSEWDVTVNQLARRVAGAYGIQ